MASKNPPRKIVTYPISENPEGGSLFIYGDSSASKIAIACPGFPDDHEVLLPFASRLANEANILVGVMCIPGFDCSETKSLSSHKKGGYSFDEMTNAVREAVKALRLESTSSSKAKLIGVFHDFGVPVGSQWANRSVEDGSSDGPDELIFFDVLLPPHVDTTDKPIAPKPTFMTKVITYFYRIIFALSFKVQHYVGKIPAVFVFLLGMIPLELFRLSPTYDIDKDVMKEREVPISLHQLIYMCYPYCHVVFKPWDIDMTLPKNLTSIPVLYMYGTEKRTQFHDYVSLKILEREESEGRSKSKAIAVDGAGHYLFVQKPDVCYEAVKDFLEKN